MKQNKPVIGIIPTFPIEETDNPYDNRASFVRMYIERIRESGGVAIGILEENVEDVLNICDGFLWPGGKKIWKCFYKVLDHALEHHKPILGVCLGSQAIATYFNILEDMSRSNLKSFDEVYQRCKEEDPYLNVLDNKRIENHSRKVPTKEENIDNAKHKITINENSLLYQILKTKEENVVSFHKYYIQRTSKDVLINAKSLDEVIEGIEYTKNNQRILGVQFHPEITKDNRLFMWLVQEARKKVTK